MGLEAMHAWDWAGLDRYIRIQMELEKQQRLEEQI